MQEDLILKVIGLAGGLAGVGGVFYKVYHDIREANAEIRRAAARSHRYIVYHRDAPRSDEHAEKKLDVLP